MRRKGNRDAPSGQNLHACELHSTTQKPPGDRLCGHCWWALLHNTQTTTKKKCFISAEGLFSAASAAVVCHHVLLYSIFGGIGWCFFNFCLFCNFGIFVLLISAHFPQHRFVSQTLMLNEYSTYVPVETGSTSDLCEVRWTKKRVPLWRINCQTCYFQFVGIAWRSDLTWSCLDFLVWCF